MTTDFNPSNPDTSGIEWMPTRRLPKPLSNVQYIGAKVTSTAAETVASVRAFLAGSSAVPVGLDIYDAADVLPAGGEFGALQIPTVDHADSGLWEEYDPSGTGAAWIPYEDAMAPNGHNFVDEIVHDHISGAEIDLATLNKIKYAPSVGHLSGKVTWQTDTTYYWAVDGTSGLSVGSNPRIGRIQVAVVARNAGGKTGTLDGWLTLAGTPFGSDSGPVSITTGGPFLVYRFTWNWNPVTGLPWLSSDLAKFQSGGDYAFGVNVTGPVGCDIVIGAVSLIERLLPEKRLAIGTVTLTPSANGLYHTFAMLKPSDGTSQNWAKANATDYLYLFHMNKPGGTVSLIGVDDDGIAGGGLGGWQGATQFATPTLFPSGAPVLTTWVPAMFHMTSAPALGADRQPYPIATTQPVYTGVGNVRQGMAAHSGAPLTSPAAYGNIRVLLARPTVTPTQPLVIGIHAVSGGGLIGGVATINPADVVYNASGFALVTARFASNASLATATAYYFDFSSSTPSTAPWQVCYAETDYTATTDGTSVAAGTIAGAATLAGTVNSLADILINAQTAPTPPGSFTATLAYRTLSPAPPGGPTRIGYAALDWANTSLGSAFGYYEVQRGGFPIAYITDESKSFFNDFEGRRATALTYQVRVVRADGAPSDFAT